MQLNFQNAIELLTAFQAVFFAIYVFTLKKEKARGNTFIALFMILFGINLGRTFIAFLLDPVAPDLYTFLELTLYLLPASLFLYTKLSLDAGYRFGWKDLVHVAPFLLLNLFLLPFIYLPETEPAEDSPVMQKLNLAYYLIFYGMLLLYQVLSFIYLARTKRLYFENFSSSEMGRFRYLVQLNLIFLIIILFSATKNLLVSNWEGWVTEIAIYLVRFSALLFFCWIVLKGLRSPELFRAEEIRPRPIKDLVAESSAKQEGNHELITRLQTYMQEHEPYLNPSLSLADLARQTQIPSRELSVLINHHLDKHFFDLVNEYRIRKAMEILKDPDRKQFTIQEILYEVGFNSKSSFNTAFKKQTGLTPSQFRKKHSLPVG